MIWESHYTGIDSASSNFGRFNLYIQRSSKTKEKTFYRISAYKRMVGLFIGRLNYGSRFGYQSGYELFSNKYHLGWLSEPKYKMPRIQWFGSSVDPYHSFAWRIGRIFVGRQTPQWVKNWKKNKEEKEFNAWLEKQEDN